jgi:hypothetical protein
LEGWTRKWRLNREHGPTLKRSPFLLRYFRVSGSGLVAASRMSAASFGIYIAVFISVIS